MKRTIIIVAIILASIELSAQRAENGFKDIITSDTLLNKFMMYWLRRPYKFGGDSEKGIDCSKLTKRLYKDVYNKIIGDIAEEQFDQSKRIKRDSLKLGDLIFFRSRQSPSGWHCGAYIGNTYFIHAANKYEGVKISSLDEPRYKKTVRGFGRFEESKL